MTSLRAPGRPRDAGIDEAILLATWQQMNQVGYTAMTMTAVAEGAGIQKPALYRRWPTKPLLVVDAMAKHLPPITFEDRGSLRADLQSLLAQEAETWRTPAVRRSFNPLLADIESDDAAKEAFRQRVVTPRGAVVRQLLARAVERGEISPDAPLDEVPAMLEGPLMHRAVLGVHRGLDANLLDRVLTSCLALLGAR